ncbi:hypothetical protein GP486_004046 [Trichoglossum hirsutum]|uniref:G domain-containing protein n=1 Tax=Trichoglossum hirsutum TaxID=265104 RepID=A0A9P8RQB8_9PEZI|nr:hypothetical protein GP486_004046 [Trichoglossum hirsutum]
MVGTSPNEIVVAVTGTTGVGESTFVRSATGNKDEIVVAVMGATGVGKSTFIKNVTGNKEVFVGHGLESGSFRSSVKITQATSEVQSYRFRYRGIKFVLVDTPGFNDSSKTDEAIMTRVLRWLESSFRAGTKLNGLVYLHRIIDPRMQGSSLRNIRMFRQLCGSDCLRNVVLATTFWEDVLPQLGESRERELRETDDFWGRMAKKGSQIVRLGNNRESGLRVLLEIAKMNKITLQSQHEIVTESKPIDTTAAARAVNGELVEKQKRELEEMLRQKKIEAELEIRRKRQREKEWLEREKRRLEKERKEKEKQEETRAKEEAAWQADFERRCREIQEERKRMKEAQKCELARIEREKLEEQKRQRRQAQQAREARQRYYRNFKCTRPVSKSVRCDKCRKLVRYQYYRKSLPNTKTYPSLSWYYTPGCATG